MVKQDEEIALLKARIEVLENAVKDGMGFLLAKFAFANDPDASEMYNDLGQALRPQRWYEELKAKNAEDRLRALNAGNE
jgi:hypothetical protein